MKDGAKRVASSFLTAFLLVSVVGSVVMVKMIADGNAGVVLIQTVEWGRDLWNEFWDFQTSHSTGNFSDALASEGPHGG